MKNSNNIASISFFIALAGYLPVLILSFAFSLRSDIVLEGLWDVDIRYPLTISVILGAVYIPLRRRFMGAFDSQEEFQFGCAGAFVTLIALWLINIVIAVDNRFLSIFSIPVSIILLFVLLFVLIFAPSFSIPFVASFMVFGSLDLTANSASGLLYITTGVWYGLVGAVSMALDFEPTEKGRDGRQRAPQVGVGIFVITGSFVGIIAGIGPGTNLFYATRIGWLPFFGVNLFTIQNTITGWVIVATAISGATGYWGIKQNLETGKVNFLSVLIPPALLVSLIAIGVLSFIVELV